MIGHVGDRIVIESEKVGQKMREGEILEVIESPVRVHYRVRWDDGHESDIRPAAGSARIVPAASQQRMATGPKAKERPSKKRTVNS